MNAKDLELRHQLTRAERPEREEERESADSLTGCAPSSTAAVALAVGPVFSRFERRKVDVEVEVVGSGSASAERLPRT
jgi:hypothetical protein